MGCNRPAGISPISPWRGSMWLAQELTVDEMDLLQACVACVLRGEAGGPRVGARRPKAVGTERRQVLTTLRQGRRLIVADLVARGRTR